MSLIERLTPSRTRSAERPIPSGTAGVSYGAVRPRRLGIKRFLPRTLFGRSLMIIITPVLLMQAIATFYFYDRHWDIMTKRLAQGVAGEIAMMMEEIDDTPDPAQWPQLFARAARTTAIIYSFTPGAVTQDLPRFVLGYEILMSQLRDALREKVRYPFSIDPTVAREWVEIQVQLPNGVLYVMTPLRRLFSDTSYIFILWMVGSALVLFAVAILFMRNQIRPIRRLAVAAERFGKGRDVPDFKLEGAAEVRQAARAFLVMRERIQRQITQRTEMLAGVSHDLRTPLTRMKLQLAMLGDAPEIDELKADVTEMEKMIEAYLAFARGEGGEAPEPTELTALLREVVGSARREGTTVHLAEGEPVTLPLRRQAFRRCLANLLSNAGQHADTVWVTARRAGSSVEVVVDDDGPGISEDQLETVFKPFYRIDASRNFETGGAGLGLTIARDIARSHGGDVKLAQAPQGGLRCVVRLPV